MVTLNDIKQIPRKLMNRLSYNSNAPTQSDYYGTSGYYYDKLRNKHEGKFSYYDYQKILEDTQVSVAVDILMNFLLSKGYVISSNSDNPEDVEIKEFIEEMFDNMDTPFRKVRKDIYTSIIYGYSVLEKVFSLDNNGHIIIKGMYGLHMKTLQDNPFIKDDNGNLIGIHQKSVNGSCDLPLEKVLFCRFNNQFDELTGQSILNRIHEYPKLKDKIITWLVTFLYKHENPVTYAKLAGNSKFKNEVLQMLDEVAEGRTSLTIGADDELNTLESSHRGEAFFNALNYFDNVIFRGLFIGTLLLGDGGQTGSYAQSKTQMEVANNIFDGVHEDIAYDIQKSIDDIVAWNFGASANSPRFSFNKFTEKDLIGLLQALQPYATSMIIDTDSQWFHELIAKVVNELSDIKVDTQQVTENTDDDVDYGMQPNVPGASDAEQIIRNQLEGIV